MAAGTGVSYESLSRDYSQSNYSSSRLALLDDRDLWRTFQLWWMRSFREELHEEWLQAAVLAGVVNIPLEQYATNPEKFEAATFKARGWSWIDPTAEVAAYKEAVKAGFITVSEVIAQTGNGLDLEDVLDERERELNEMKGKGLDFDTSPGVFIPAETRGNMVMGPDGLVEPAATVAPAAPASNEPAPPARTLSIAR
jgi:lambda family phage portal protein